MKTKALQGGSNSDETGHVMSTQVHGSGSQASNDSSCIDLTTHGVYDIQSLQETNGSLPIASNSSSHSDSHNSLHIVEGSNKCKSKETQHTNPNWLTDLDRNFQNVIVDKCSLMTREAVSGNEDLKVRPVIL